jgi:hypothetical protein
MLPKIWPPSFALNKTVNVPFGSFKNCLETEEFTPLEPGVLDHKFYAPWYWIHSIRRAQRRSGTDIIQASTAFLEITGNYFPVLHAGCILSLLLSTQQ